MTLKTFSAALWLSSAAAHAHDGHGLPGASHWHAGDALLLVAAVAVALWAVARRKP